MSEETQQTHKRIKKRSEQGLFEALFEGVIWKSRFIVLLAVIFGLVGAIVLFIVASFDIASIASYTWHGLFATPNLKISMKI